jgi:CBS-domain-containing membrane protein
MRQGRSLVKQPAQCVEALMARDVRTIRSDADVHELERLLLRERIHGVPVVDPDGRLAGVASQTDLLAWHFATGVDGATFYEAPAGRPPGGTRRTDVRAARVEEVMSPLVHCICPDDPVTLAAARMIERKVHRLIVVDEHGRVRGILAAVDLLRALPGVERQMHRARDERHLYTGGPTP